MHPKNNFELIADHLAYGAVTFLIPADDAKDAFSRWKQIVTSPRQWIVRRNEGTDGTAAPARTAKRRTEVSDLYEIDEMDDKIIWTKT